MARPGTISGKELEGYASSGQAVFGSVLMATGDGNCFWIFLQEIVDNIEAIWGGTASAELEFFFGGGTAAAGIGLAVFGAGAA